MREIENNSGGVRAVALKLELSKHSTFESLAQKVKVGLKPVWNRVIGRDPM